MNYLSANVLYACLMVGCYATRVCGFYFSSTCTMSLSLDVSMALFISTSIPAEAIVILLPTRIASFFSMYLL
jgi:hypothetical protein